MSMSDLQKIVKNTAKKWDLEDFIEFSLEFIDAISTQKITTIISPTDHKYIFYQFDSNYNHAISRPLNTDLFINSKSKFQHSVNQLTEILNIIQNNKSDSTKTIEKEGLDPTKIDSTVYTMQQCIGVVGDAFNNSNQSRKLIGQLFESMVRDILSKVGVTTEPREIRIPIPGSQKTMKFQLDFVFTRNAAIVTGENIHTVSLNNTSEDNEEFIANNEIVGSVKTTSKDRIDKLFLDKFMLSRLIGRDIPVAAIFLHDVQRARRGNHEFGIASTFKSGHFMGYSVALNKLDGVYYVDPRPIMKEDDDLHNHISRFSDFIVKDVWTL